MDVSRRAGLVVGMVNRDKQIPHFIVLSYDKLEEILTRIFSLRPADKFAGGDFHASFGE